MRDLGDAIMVFWQLGGSCAHPATLRLKELDAFLRAAKERNAADVGRYSARPKDLFAVVANDIPAIQFTRDQQSVDLTEGALNYFLKAGYASIKM